MAVRNQKLVIYTRKSEPEQFDIQLALHNNDLPTGDPHIDVSQYMDKANWKLVSTSDVGINEFHCMVAINQPDAV
jgi:hypothetical protein